MSYGPVRPAERIELLDLLRGFALFGILQVNWTDYGPWFNFFIDGSFYTSFSLLFGLGFAIQLLRAQESGRALAARYIWRSFLLLLIGSAHFIFIWHGDIVRAYAILAPLLLLVGRWRPAAVLGLAAVMLVLSMYPTRNLPPTGHTLRRVEIDEVVEVTARDTKRQLIAQQYTMMRTAAEAGSEPYSTAVAAAAGQWQDWLTRVGSLRWFKGQADILGMFLLGLWIGRKQILRNPRQHRRLLLGVMAGSLVIGLPLSVVDAFPGFVEKLGVATPEFMNRWFIAYGAGNIGLAIFYLSALTLLCTSFERVRSFLAPLAAVGRIGLTNYIMQSVLITTLFYGNRFGLNNLELSFAWQLAIINAVFILQMMYSRWWIERFAFGPVEWVWRSLTWFRPQPLRLQPAARAYPQPAVPAALGNAETAAQ